MNFAEALNTVSRSFKELSMILKLDNIDPFQRKKPQFSRFFDFRKKHNDLFVQSNYAEKAKFLFQLRFYRIPIYILTKFYSNQSSVNF